MAEKELSSTFQKVIWKESFLKHLKRVRLVH